MCAPEFLNTERNVSGNSVQCLPYSYATVTASGTHTSQAAVSRFYRCYYFTGSGPHLTSLSGAKPGAQERAWCKL